MRSKQIISICDVNFLRFGFKIVKEHFDFRRYFQFLQEIEKKNTPIVYYLYVQFVFLFGKISFIMQITTVIKTTNHKKHKKMMNNKVKCHLLIAQQLGSKART